MNYKNIKLEYRNNDGWDCRNCGHAHYLILTGKPCASPWVSLTKKCNCDNFEFEDNLKYLEQLYDQKVKANV